VAPAGGESDMLWFLLKRVVLIAAMLCGLLVITFIISHVAPVDPAGLAAGPDATAEMIAKVREEFSLDKPLWHQFIIYISGILAGDWGRSILSTKPVWEDIGVFLPATIELVAVAIILAIVVGVPLGVLSAVFKNKPLDHGIRILAVSGVAVPMFCLGLLLQWFFGLMLGWFPITGRLSMMTYIPDPITHLIVVDALLRGQTDTFFEALQFMALPALTLSFPALASVIRVNRAEMLETLNKDYIINARAQGLSNSRIIGAYALKNAMLPTLAMIGLRFGWMLGGTVLVESVFNWPGIGLYAVEAAIHSDFEPLMAATLLMGFMFMAVNLLIDILYGVLDPRVRQQI